MRLVAAWLALTCVLSAQLRTPSADPLRAFNDSLVRLAAKLSPAVVRVMSNAYRPASTNDAAESADAVALRQTTGSGVILTSDGHIVTSAHVISGATRIQVQLPPVDAPPGKSIVQPRGRVVTARLVGSDPETDLALLKVDASGLPHLPLGDSDAVQQGQIVLALGNPLGLDNTVNMGVISAVARQLRPDDRVVYIQTDAPINPGNSGGPLVNIDGAVIGINAMILTQSGGSEGVGFAVPSNIVLNVMDQLIRTGTVTRGDIGVEAQTITPVMAAALGLPRERGVILADVLPNRPGDTADLRVGDIVLSLNGKPMENARQFHVNLYSKAVASTVTLEILRGPETLTKTVVVLEREDDPDRLAKLVNERQHLIARLGLLGVALDPKIAEALPKLRRSYGILVARLVVSARGPAGVFQRGDVIYTLNNQPLSTLTELRSLLEKFQPGDTVVMQVERGGKIRYLEVPLE